MRHRLKVRALRIVWVFALLAVVFVPLLLSTSAGGRGDFTIELSLTFGLLGFSALVSAAVLPSRVRSLTTAFGIARVLRSHRWLALAALALILAHLFFVIVDNPANLALLDLRHAPPRARAATVATLALIALCALSLARRRLNTRYQHWRRLHVALAVVALVGSLLHVLWLNHLVRDPAMRAFFSVVAVILAMFLANRWVRRPLRAMRHSYRVDEIRRETPTVSTLVLRPASSRQPALRFRPGQFAWIRFGSLLWVQESHPFTIASGSHDPRFLEFTIKHSGDWTRRLSMLRPGGRVYVDGPHGDFTVDRRPSKRLLLIAAGVGVTPMMSMLRTLADRGDTRVLRLVVGARTPDELLFHREMMDLCGRLRLTVVEVLSDPTPDWQGARGQVDRTVLGQVLSGRAGARGVDVYICGPPAMVSASVEALEELGVPAQHVHTEQFDMV